MANRNAPQFATSPDRDERSRPIVVRDRPDPISPSGAPSDHDQEMKSKPV